MPGERDPLIVHSLEAQVACNGKDGTHIRKPADDSVLETAVTGRTIGSASAYVLVLSRVIGSGIFAMPGTIIQSVGSPGLSLLLWVAGALIAWCGLAIDLEYGCMLPRSGGIKVYLEHTYPQPRYLASTLIAVHVVILGFTASNCIIFAKYALFALDVEATDFVVKAVAVGLMTIITIVHGCMYRAGIWIQNLLGGLKIVLVVFMVLTSLFVVMLEPRPSLDETTLTTASGLWDDSDWTYNTVATALFKIFYSYAGLDNINNVLNEVKDPVRTLRWVPSVSLLTACALYLLINLAYLAVVPLKEIKQSRELIAALFFQGVFGEGIGNKLLPFGIALSAAGNVMVVTFSLARLNQEVARQGLLPFPELFASSRPFNAPLGGLIIHYMPSVLVICLPSSKDVYAFIANVEGYTGQFFALSVAVGLIILRYREPDMLRPFRAWLPAVYLRIVLCVCLIIAPLVSFSQTPQEKHLPKVIYALVSISTIIVSLLYWVVRFRLIPYFCDYRVTEFGDTLMDGTTILRLKYMRR